VRPAATSVRSRWSLAVTGRTSTVWAAGHQGTPVGSGAALVVTGDPPAPSRRAAGYGPPQRPAAHQRQRPRRSDCTAPPTATDRQPGTAAGAHIQHKRLDRQGHGTGGRGELADEYGQQRDRQRAATDDGHAGHARVTIPWVRVCASNSDSTTARPSTRRRRRRRSSGAWMWVPLLRTCSSRSRRCKPPTRPPSWCASSTRWHRFCTTWPPAGAQDHQPQGPCRQHRQGPRPDLSQGARRRNRTVPADHL
jgi:hypothetical protein